METVYIETSVVSYLVARPLAGTLSHQWHTWTRDWWGLRRPVFECVISPEVLREAAEGVPEMSRLRLEALSGLTLLRRTPDVDELAEAFLAAGPLPTKAQADAVHLAVATIYRVDYLATWNLKHLANAIILARLRPVAEKRGLRLPVVCTPLQLMGTIEYEG
jgi:predicted nucleic acid-binding protein